MYYFSSYFYHDNDSVLNSFVSERKTGDRKIRKGIERRVREHKIRLNE